LRLAHAVDVGEARHRLKGRDRGVWSSETELEQAERRAGGRVHR